MLRKILVLFSLYGSVHAADHVDNPAEVLEPATDVTDLFMFRSANGRLVLIFNVFLGAGSKSKFSDAPEYRIVFNQLDPSKANGLEWADGIEHVIACQFDSGLVQQFRCQLQGPGGQLAKARGETNQWQHAQKNRNKFKVFAGAVRDPFFLNDANVFKPRRAGVPDPVGDDPIEGNILAFNNVLAIVAEIDPQLLPAGTKYLGAYAEVIVRRQTAEGHLVSVVDRIGRPEMTNITMNHNDTKFLWNHENTLSLSGTFIEQYRRVTDRGIVALDQLDGQDDWAPEQRRSLVNILLQDFLWLDFSKPGRATTNKNHYLELEKSFLATGSVSGTGGRHLDDDMIDTILTYYIGGPEGVRRTDQAPAPPEPAQRTFPYVNPPLEVRR